MHRLFAWVPTGPWDTTLPGRDSPPVADLVPRCEGNVGRPAEYGNHQTKMVKKNKILTFWYFLQNHSCDARVMSWVFRRVRSVPKSRFLSGFESRENGWSPGITAERQGEVSWWKANHNRKYFRQKVEILNFHHIFDVFTIFPSCFRVNLRCIYHFLYPIIIGNLPRLETWWKDE